jgi:type VI protein secretion system component VasK
VTPLATEAIWAVFGGLIPIVGALAIALIIWRAVRSNPEDEDPSDS